MNLKPMPQHLDLYDAAAGAGKTHALVQYYLTKALQNPTAFPAIWAITFTNKATQEMKQRILVYLDRLSHGEMTALAETLAANLGLKQTDIPEKATEVLKHILHNYSHFTITTIDGLANWLTRICRYELGVAFDYRLVLDTEHALKHCVEQMMATLPQHPRLQKDMVQWALARLQKGLHWDIQDEITKLGRDLLQRHAARGRTPQKEKSSDHHTENYDALFHQATVIEKTLQSKATSLQKQIKEAGATPDQLAWGRQGVYSYLEKLTNRLIVPFGSRVTQARKGRWLSGKGSDHTHLKELALTEWTPALEDILTYYETHSTTYYTIQALWPLRYAFAITQHLDHVIANYQTENEELLITYLPELLEHILHDMPAGLLKAKIGTPYTSLLIDEFQDVSQSQWKNMAPLLQNTITEGKGSLIVGDIKQALYRWRGGDTSIFLTQVEQTIGRNHLQRKALTFNWRSAPQIIAFNNRFFSRAAQTLQYRLADKVVHEVDNPETRQVLLDNIKQIGQAYAHVVQKVPPSQAKNESRGYIHFTFLPKTKRNEDNDSIDTSYKWQEEAVKQAVEKIEYMQRKGYKAKEIALLVRNRREAEWLMKALMERAKSPKADPTIIYEAMTLQGLAVDKHPTIQLLTNALIYLEDKEDKNNLASLVHLYQQTKQENQEVHRYLGAIADEEKIVSFLPEKLVSQREELKRLPLYHLAEELIDIFSLRSSEANPYLTVWQDRLHRWITEGQGGRKEWLVWWQIKGHQLRLSTSSTSLDKLTITTIHQAKGLAYQVVIVPFCAWSLDHPPHNPPICWSKTEAMPFAGLGDVPFYYKSSLQNTHYQMAYYQEEWQVYLEQLNLLYVAFTRAIEELHIIAPKRLSPANNVADFLQEVLQEENILANSEDQVILGSERNHIPKMAPLLGKQEKTREPQHKQEAKKRYAFFEQLQTPPDEKGMWWHDFFAASETTADVEPYLKRQVKQGVISTLMAEEVRVSMAKWCENRQFASWFSKAFTIVSERPILLRNGQVVRPDRVLLGDKVSIVVDFKTGQPKEAHHKQVQGYAKYLGAMGYSGLAAYLFYTDSGKIIEVKI